MDENQNANSQRGNTSDQHPHPSRVRSHTKSHSSFKNALSYENCRQQHRKSHYASERKESQPAARDQIKLVGKCHAY